MTSAELIESPPAIPIPAGYSLLRWEATDEFQPGHITIVLCNDETKEEVWVVEEFGPETTGAELDECIAASIGLGISRKDNSC